MNKAIGTGMVSPLQLWKSHPTNIAEEPQRGVYANFAVGLSDAAGVRSRKTPEVGQDRPKLVNRPH